MEWGLLVLISIAVQDSQHVSLHVNDKIAISGTTAIVKDLLPASEHFLEQPGLSWNRTPAGARLPLRSQGAPEALILNYNGGMSNLPASVLSAKKAFLIGLLAYAAKVSNLASNSNLPALGKTKVSPNTASLIASWSF